MGDEHTTGEQAPRLRQAGAGDAAALAALAESTFRAAFTATNTAANMDAHCAATYGEALQAREIADPRVITLVADHGGDLIGYGQLRWGEAPPGVEAARPAEIQRLYVDARWHGRGIAQKLMSALLSLAATAGADGVWLGVWEHNPRAIAFYQKSGFTVVGDHVFHVGSDPQRDLLMARSVAPLPAVN